MVIIWVGGSHACPSLTWNYPRVIISVQKKWCGMNFHDGSWFFALENLMGATQFCGISRGEVSFRLEFPKAGIKWQILKFQGPFLRKHVLLPLPYLDFLWNNPIHQLLLESVHWPVGGGHSLTQNKWFGLGYLDD